MTLGLPWQAVGIRPLKWKIPARQEEGQATRCEARIFSKIPCSVRSAAESWVPKDLHQESRSLVGRRYCTALPCPGPRSSRAGWPAVQGTLQCGWHPDRGAGLAQELPTESCANATPHVAQNTSHRSSAIDGRTSRHPGCAMSQRFRKRIGECFGWAGVIGGIRKSRLAGREKLDFPFVPTLSACAIRGWRHVDGRASRDWCAWKQANRARLANVRPEGRSHRASSAAGCRKGPFSRVVFNGRLVLQFVPGGARGICHLPGW